ncbi:MAG: amidohydrolase family protein [Gemmatimonadales bacterium]
MNRLLLLLLLALVGGCAPVRSGSVPVAADLALTHVNVVDVESGRVLPDQTVLIAGNRIQAVGPSSKVGVPAGARVVDATGKHLIPGLWDMHVHLFNQISRRPPNPWYFPLFVANGVTGVREMWVKEPDVPMLQDWREQIAAGTLLGPRIAAAGALVDGGGSIWPTTDQVTTPEEARQFVRESHRLGLDFIKTYYNVSPEAYQAIAEEARSLGIPVAGHIPMLVRAADAGAAGHRSNEHLTQVREACSTQEQQILLERQRLDSGPHTVAQADSLWSRHEWLRTQTYDPGTCKAVARQLAAAPMWQVPTLLNERGYFVGPPDSAEHDPRLAYIPGEERRVWSEGLRQFGAEHAAKAQGAAEARTAQWRATLALVRTLAREGVPFLAGTDLGGGYIFPGSGLHDELALMVEAGLSPFEALRAATLEPARYLGATDSLGTIALGKLADLVLLSANPLEDIRNTQQIEAVVLNGRYLDRRALDGLLTEAEGAANRWLPRGLTKG